MDLWLYLCSWLCESNCHFTWKYRGSPHRDCNINVKLNHKIPIVVLNPKNIDAITKQIQFKIKVIPNGLEKYMSFEINNKLIFIYDFQFLNSSLHSLAKNLGKNDFKYLRKDLIITF